MEIDKGLEGVVVAETAISDVRGGTGELVFRGRSIEHWVQRPFIDAASAIVDYSGDLAQALYDWGKLSSEEENLVLSLSATQSSASVHPMSMLQCLVPTLATPGGGLLTDGLVVAAKLPQLIATHMAGRKIPYPKEKDYINRFLMQVPGSNQTAADALSVTQILQLEHSLNAGTFAGRVVASTLASVEASIAAAFGALSGSLHGGADQAAMEMADHIGDPARAADFVRTALAAGEKIMGMGHREYKVVDPRARYVKRLAGQLSENTEHAKTFATLCAVEDAVTKAMAEKGKPVHANLEFYKGLLYRCAGFPDRYFTALFAMARVFGYVAHIAESRIDNRIIRPAARYVGPALMG